MLDQQFPSSKTFHISISNQYVTQAAVTGTVLTFDGVIQASILSEQQQQQSLKVKRWMQEKAMDGPDKIGRF